MVTAHAGESAAYTWRLAHFTLGQHMLLPPDAPQQHHLQQQLPPVSAVSISSCGNFGLVGTEGGRVDRYNLQSGIHRGTYSRSTTQHQQQSTTQAAGEGVWFKVACEAHVQEDVCWQPWAEAVCHLA